MGKPKLGRCLHLVVKYRHTTMLIMFLLFPLFSSETSLFFLFFLSHVIIQAFSVSLNQPAGTHAEATVAETWSNL